MVDRSTGRFLTLEGSEGAGKSSNLEIVVATLHDCGIDATTTREPGGTEVGESIRELLLAVRDEPLDDLTELLLMFAARAQHLTTKIRPMLSAGTWVVCDRFTDATYAYQGGGRGIDSASIALLEKLVHGDLQPDLTLYLDVPVDIAFQRIGERELDRIEREERAFFERVRTNYLERARRQDRIQIIDASASLEAVAATVEQAVRRFVATQP
jgi:dTMP kinase